MYRESSLFLPTDTRCVKAPKTTMNVRGDISRSSFVDTDSMRLSEALWGGRSIGGGGSVGGSRGRHGRYFLKNDSERTGKELKFLSEPGEAGKLMEQGLYLPYYARSTNPNNAVHRLHQRQNGRQRIVQL